MYWPDEDLVQVEKHLYEVLAPFDRLLGTTSLEINHRIFQYQVYIHAHSKKKLVT